MRVALRCAVVLVWTALPSLAFAQASITGTVKDTSGAVLPESPWKPQAPC